MQTPGAKARILWSELIRAVEHCELCGVVGAPDAQGRMIVGLHAHHLIPSTRLQFKYLIENGLCLCSGCHQVWHVNDAGQNLLLEKLLIINPTKWAFYQTNIGQASRGVECDREALDRLKLEKPDILQAAIYNSCF